MKNNSLNNSMRLIVILTVIIATFNTITPAYAQMRDIYVINDENWEPIENGDTTPSTLEYTDFGDKAINTFMEYRYDICNQDLGIIDLHLTGTPAVTLTGDDSFSISSYPESSVITPKTCVTFHVRFAPTTTGVKTATVNITSDDPIINPYTFMITGNGLTPTAPAEIDINSVVSGGTESPFGGSVATDSSRTVYYSICNKGDFDLTLTGTPLIQISGDASFSAIVSGSVDTDPVILGRTCTGFGVKFAPTTTGTKYATVSIPNDDSDENPYTFTISGNGIIPNPDITIRDEDAGVEITTGDMTYWGSVAANATQEHTYHICNEGATTDLHLTGTPAVQLTGDADFSVVARTPPMSTTITHTYCEYFTITFSPATPGTKSVTVSIPNNVANKNPFTFAITGNATGTGIVTLTPTITPTATNTPTLCYAQTQIPPTECNALVILYNSTHGSNWLDHDFWLSNTKPCDMWDGVICTDGHVTGLFLPGNRLAGTIPAQLSDLTQLDELDLAQNSLTGAIPAQLGDLSQLTGLNLSQNQLTGSIPPQLGNLTNLLSLSLQRNRLTGAIPPELGNLTSLYSLSLQNNLLSGSIPPTFGNLTNLGVLSLSSNRITGNIPTQLGNLWNLQSLYLDTTQMAGEIPTSFVKLKNLFNLKLNCGLTSYNSMVVQFINKLIPGWLNKVCLSNLIFRSIGTQDGWVNESAENSSIGGTFNSTSTTFNLGDNGKRIQSRGILSFNTQAIPDNAIIIKVTLKVKKNGVAGSGDPLIIFNGFVADIKNGFFGTAALEAADFQTPASGTYGPTIPPIANNIYSITLTAGASNINKLMTNGGTTQIRLRFQLDDNNNTIANYLSLFSGNATNISDRPQLVVTYYAP